MLRAVTNCLSGYLPVLRALQGYWCCRLLRPKYQPQYQYAQLLNRLLIEDERSNTE